MIDKLRESYTYMPLVVAEQIKINFLLKAFHRKQAHEARIQPLTTRLVYLSHEGHKDVNTHGYCASQCRLKFSLLRREGTWVKGHFRLSILPKHHVQVHMWPCIEHSSVETSTCRFLTTQLNPTLMT